MATIKWRLHHSGHLSGARNMAIDESILRAVADRGVPTLRFYGWDPPAVSVGYFQDVEREVDTAACRSLGVDIVRRPTGGRAVLHDVEVTYSLVIPEDNPIIPRGITESYRAISEGMVRGLTALGLDAKMVSLRRRRATERETAESHRHEVEGAEAVNAPVPSEPTGTRTMSRRYEVTVEAPDKKPSSAACFDAPSWYEVTVGGKKVVGSAQVRKDKVLLQHGSIPLELEADKLFTCLRYPNADARERAKGIFLRKATSIRSALGRPISYMEVCEALVAGLEETLGVEICEDDLTRSELEVAENLARTKYSRLNWNQSDGAEGTQSA